ncbi:AEC family transporter [Synechococcus sp. RS9916]|uniref:AEC family transporter n=1 Tax=Synechococcus sp. RS9916 TaxID=221359 RepID=UPI0000E53877|nr:AEC family transporter [Synechococcus sp. RS9916]EAU74006.1 possible AEC transporter family protein [Synechococcus sp. RS9916]
MAIVSLFVELIPSLGLGLWIGWLKPGWTRPVAMPLVRFGVPISLMGLLLKGGIHWSMAMNALIAALAIGLWMLGLQGLPSEAKPVDSPALQIGSAVGNTAYFGIPVALALLPSQALPISIGYDLGATLLAWSLGPFWLKQEAGGWRELMRHVMSSPATRGLLAALIVKATPWSNAIASALWLPSRMVIVLALVVVGMRLGSIQSARANAPHPATQLASRSGNQQLHAALACKLLLFPAWMWLLCSLLSLEPLTCQALVLQGAAPASISMLLMAEQAGRDAEQAASLLLRSTLLALVSVPLWWLVLMQTLGTPGR